MAILAGYESLRRVAAEADMGVDYFSSSFFATLACVHACAASLSRVAFALADLRCHFAMRSCRKVMNGCIRYGDMIIVYTYIPTHTHARAHTHAHTLIFLLTIYT